MLRAAGLAGVLMATAATGALAAEFDPYASLTAQAAAMASGRTTSAALTEAYLARIAALDRQGPRLNSVIAVNPHALADARRLDAERKAGKVRGPLHGVAILVKDNIDTDDGTATTAGSLALKDNVTGRDAPVAARLKAAGAVILGKANLSQWANFRSTRSISGWSSVGGLTRNPHALDRGTCGSSSGSGAATAAGFAAGAIGTETDGSIVCPAAMNGIVGLKPTVGLVSRTHIVPISASQDTAGPMTRTVADAAAILTAIAGTDPADPATAAADAHKQDYAQALDAQALKGARIGVLRLPGRSPAVDAVFDQALALMKDAGAVLVEVKLPPTQPVNDAELVVLQTEFKAGVNAYLASTSPDKVKTRTLADLIAFNRAEPRELALFGQEIFEASQATGGLADPAYLKALADSRRMAGPEGLDKLLHDAGVDVLVAASPPSSVIDPVNGARGGGPPAGLPAVAGYPHLVLPMGAVSGMPVALSIIGPAWSEARLLALGYAFEQKRPARLNPTFQATVSGQADIAAAFDPRP